MNGAYIQFKSSTLCTKKDGINYKSDTFFCYQLSTLHTRTTSDKKTKKNFMSKHVTYDLYDTKFWKMLSFSTDEQKKKSTTTPLFHKGVVERKIIPKTFQNK